MGVTKLANLVDPEVMADLVQKKLCDNLVFGAIADVDYSLNATPGSTLLFPCYSYIGTAQTVGENSSISMATLTASTVSVTVHKLATGVTLTDESVLSGYGDPMGEAVTQIALSLNDGLDGEILTTLSGIGSTMTYKTSGSTVYPSVTDIPDALEKFGEDIDGVKVLYVAPSVYTGMRKAGVSGGFFPASEMAAEIAVKGSLGEYQGCNVIVTNRLKTSKDAYIVKPGAVRIVMKRDVQIESDRDIVKKATAITGDVHEATYLYDPSKAIKITHA